VRQKNKFPTWATWLTDPMMEPFAISTSFSPGQAAIGGAVLATAVIFKTTMVGEVLGVSGSTRSIIAKGASSNRVAFIFGLMLSGLVAAAVGEGSGI